MLDLPSLQPEPESTMPASTETPVLSPIEIKFDELYGKITMNSKEDRECLYKIFISGALAATTLFGEAGKDDQARAKVAVSIMIQAVKNLTK